MKMQLQILFQAYFCTDAVLLQYLISFNLLPSDMASVAALYVNSFQGLLFKQQLYSNVFKKCLKITEKVSFNIASEASYVYIYSEQKFIKNDKNYRFWRVF